MDRHLRRTRRSYLRRRDRLVTAIGDRLPGVQIGGISAGLHLIVWLPEDSNEKRIAEEAARRGVAIHTLHRDCSTHALIGPALLLGYGLIGESAIDEGVSELAAAIAAVRS